MRRCSTSTSSRHGRMFFDGSARADGAGAEVVFMSPQRQILPYSFQLSELWSNNVAEYQALIIGLQMAINMEITALEVYGNSKLIINQLLTEYKVRKDDLVLYFQLATQLLQKFEGSDTRTCVKKRKSNGRRSRQPSLNYDTMRRRRCRCASLPNMGDPACYWIATGWYKCHLSTSNRCWRVETAVDRLLGAQKASRWS